MSRIRRFLRSLGVALIIVYFGVRADSLLFSRIALWRFQTAHAASTETSPSAVGSSIRTAPVTFTRWSRQPVQAFKESLSHEFGQPIAVLNIPRLGSLLPCLRVLTM